jgi:hypothetical protein
MVCSVLDKPQISPLRYASVEMTNLFGFKCLGLKREAAMEKRMSRSL